MYEPHSVLEDTKILAGTAVGVALVALAPQVVLASSTTTQSVMAIGGGASFIFDTAGQYVSTDGFTTSGYRPGQSVFAGLTGSALAPLGLSWTSTGSLSLNILNSAALGGAGSATTTTFNNYFYNENKDVGYAAGVGAFFGVVGLGASSVTAQYVAPLNSNVSILFQDYYKNFLISNGVGSALSSSSSLIETPDTETQPRVK